MKLGPWTRIGIGIAFARHFSAVGAHSQPRWLHIHPACSETQPRCLGRIPLHGTPVLFNPLSER